MSAPGWMPLHVGEYLADTGHLSAAEHGAYLLLIMHYWQHRSLPDDDRKLARICRMEPDDFSAARETLAEFFGEGWAHKRIDAELAKADEKYEKRASAGRKGGNAKAAASIATAMPKQCSTNNTDIDKTEEDTEADASAPVPSPEPEPVYADIRHQLWSEGKLMLRAMGVSEANAGKHIGRWLKDTEDDCSAVLGAIQRARDHRPAGDVIAFITASIPTKSRRHEPRSHRQQIPHDTHFSAVAELLGVERDGGAGRTRSPGPIDAERDGAGVYRLPGRLA